MYLCLKSGSPLPNIFSRFRGAEVRLIFDGRLERHRNSFKLRAAQSASIFATVPSHVMWPQGMISSAPWPTLDTRA